MLEFTAIAIAVLTGVATISVKLGHRLGAKWTVREIVRLFQREIVSNDEELKIVAEHLHGRRDVTKVAKTLLGAAMREGEMIQANISAPKPDETCLVMKTKDLQHVVSLADVGLCTWTAEGEFPFRAGDKLSYEQAEYLVSVLDTFERRVVRDLRLETELDKQKRFNNCESRMVRVWNAYGKT
jgi:hypothetical protein